MMIKEFSIAININYSTKDDLVESMQDDMRRLANSIIDQASIMTDYGSATVCEAGLIATVTNGVWAGNCQTHGDVWVTKGALFCPECPECGEELLPF